MLGNAEQDMIMNFTGCMKPCQYKEYKLVWEEKRPAIGKPDIWFEFADGKVMIEKELTSYSGLSLLVDIGGSLGMFLGFSFLMVWDGVEAVMMKIRQVWRARPDAQQINGP